MKIFLILKPANMAVTMTIMKGEWGGISLDIAYEIFSIIWFIKESNKHENVIKLKLGNTLGVYCFRSNYHQPLKLDEAAFYEPYEGPLFTVAEHQSMSSGTRHYRKQIFSNKGRY